MSILAVQIVDFDLRIVSYLLVLSNLNLELGKTAKNAPQDHVVSAEKWGALDWAGFDAEI